MKLLRSIGPADWITLANGLIGLLAIMYSIDRSWYFPIPLILIAVLLDGVDGFVARRIGSNHAFGHYLDSISDTVSFCFAPAILLYTRFYDPSRGSAFVNAENAFIIIACTVVVGAGILRLAEYVSSGHTLDYFEGLPTPAMAIFVVVFSYLDIHSPTLPSALAPLTHPIITGVAISIVGLLMLTDLSYTRFQGIFAITAAAAILFLLIAALAAITLYFVPVMTLFGLILAYIVLGPWYTRKKECKGWSVKGEV